MHDSLPEPGRAMQDRGLKLFTGPPQYPYLGHSADRPGNHTG